MLESAIGSAPTAPGVSVVVMTYDEARSLEAVVREIDGVLAGLGRRYEIVVVDDGSTDGSGHLADRLAGELERVRVVHHPHNLGLGAVYRSGFATAREDLVTFFPADGQFPATILAAFLREIDDVDFVLGYLPRRDDPLLSRALSALERAAVRLLVGPLPRFQGVFLARRAVIEGLPLTSTDGRGAGVVMELLVRAMRARKRMKSLPTELRPRAHGRSKVTNARTIWANVTELLALARRIER